MSTWTINPSEYEAYRQRHGGSSLLPHVGRGSSFVTFADKLVWGALALAIPGTALASYFFCKARQMASGKL